MKKKIFVYFIILLFCTSCNKAFEAPVGVWKSDEPNVVMYIGNEFNMPDLQNHYCCMYTVNGNVIKMGVVFASHSRRLDIFYHSSFNSGKMQTSTRDFVIGNYRIKDDKLFLTIGRKDLNNLAEIVFEKQEEYDEIDPTEWGPPEEGEETDDHLRGNYLDMIR